MNVTDAAGATSATGSCTLFPPLRSQSSLSCGVCEPRWNADALDHIVVPVLVIVIDTTTVSSRLIAWGTPRCSMNAALLMTSCTGSADGAMAAWSGTILRW
nr:hypothetical protein [Nocardia amamiensis]